MNAQLLLDESGKEGDHLVLAVVDKDLSGLLLELRQPVQQLPLVRVAGLAGHGGNAGPDRHLFIEEFDGFGPLQQAPAQGAFGLIAHKEHRGAAAPQIVLQMVPDPASLAHTAGG